MRSRIFAGGALVLVLAGMLFWQVADAQYPGPGGGGPLGPGMMGGYGYGMGPGTMGPGMMGRGLRVQQVNLNVTVADVKFYLERWIAFSGNPHIKVGDVTEKNVDTITADIVTTDKAALVKRYAIDRHTGLFQPEGG